MKNPTGYYSADWEVCRAQFIITNMSGFSLRSERRPTKTYKLHRYRFAGEVAGGEGGLKIVPPGVGIDIDNLTGKIKSLDNP